MTSDRQRGTRLSRVERWEPDHRHGMPRRIAALLDWGARHQPGVFIPYPEIAQCVLRLKRRPAPDSKLTRAVVEDVYHARKPLAEFGRDLITNGRGARATVDAEEIFRFRLGTDLAHVVSQLERYGRTARLVREAGVADPRLAEYARHADAFARLWGVHMREALAEWSAVATDADEANDGGHEPDGYSDG